MEPIEILYKRYYRNIYSLAYRMTGNAEAANDITHDTFFQAIGSLEKFEHKSSIYTWLYKIAKNNCLQYLERKHKTTFVSLQELIDKNSSPVSDEITEAEKTKYINQVKEGCLLGLLRCLSLRQRLAFILHVLLNLPIGQVASVIDKSENATRILVHRAKQNITNFLCVNCSLYNSKNTCKCENLINFSLKQGWIRMDSCGSDAVQLESEIKHLKKVINLYKSIPEPTSAIQLEKQIKSLLVDNENYLIFNNKKVK